MYRSTIVEDDASLSSSNDYSSEKSINPNKKSLLPTINDLFFG